MCIRDSYKAALQTAKANVAAAEASVATAQLTYDSKKELFAKNVVSQFDLQTSQNNLLTAKSQLAQAEAQLVNAANNLSYTCLLYTSYLSNYDFDQKSAPFRYST